MEDMRGVALRTGPHGPISTEATARGLAEISTVIEDSGQTSSGTLVNQLKNAVDGIVHNDERMYHNNEAVVLF